MQIVINLPESYYEGVMLDRILETTLDGILEAIKNGKVLPKHGRLIDADALEIKNLASNVSNINIWGVAPLDIDNAPTILEANEE